MKKYIILLLLALGSTSLFAQQQFQLTQVTHSPTLYNPAFVGIENFTDVKFGFRKQWTGLNDSPTTAYLSVNGILFSEAKRKSRRRRLKYKSPYDIDQLVNELEFPLNNMRISKPDAYVTYAKDSIRKAVRKLDHKAKAELRKHLKSKSFEGGLKHAAGGALISDQFGGFSKYAAQLSYALHLPLNREWQMSLGIAGIFASNKLDMSGITVADPDNDDIYNAYLQGNLSETAFYLNTGATIYSEKLYFGYSIVQLLAKGVTQEVNFSESSKETEHTLLTGLKIPINPQLQIIPGIFYQVKTNLPSVVNLNVQAVYMDKFSAGLYYRNKDAFSIMASMMATDALRVGYSYDYTISELSTYNSGSHEITLGFMLGKSKAPNPYLW